MKMSDEQFEGAMTALEVNGYDRTVAQLRARDTAQREDLARVEAKLGNKTGTVDFLKRSNDRLTAQLAEAVQILRMVQGARIDSHFPYTQKCVEGFLSVLDNAKAEQQEAREPVLARPEHGVSLDEAMTLTMDRYSGALDKLAVIEQQEAPIPEYFQEACDKFDWTPEEALRFYAEGKHFDTDRGRTRILDTGAIASNALKHASLPYLEMKGDAELSELRAAVGAKQEAQGEQAGDLASAVRVLLEVPQLQGEQAFSAQPIIDRVRAALATPPAASEPVAFDGKTVADRLDQMADAQPSGSSAQSDLYAAATVWRKHLAPPAAAHGDEYEIWSAAQLSPGEGIEDGAERIRALIEKPAAHGDEAVRKDAEAAYIEMTCQPVLIDGAHHYYLSSERMQAFDRLFSVDVSDAAIRAQVDGGIGDA